MGPFLFEYHSVRAVVMSLSSPRHIPTLSDEAGMLLYDLWLDVTLSPGPLPAGAQRILYIYLLIPDV